MAKVGVSLGLTLKLFKDSSYEFVRPTIEINEIDTESPVPVEKQLELAVAALKKTIDATNSALNEEIIAKMPQVDAEMELQITRRLQKTDKLVDELKKQVQDLAGKKK